MDNDNIQYYQNLQGEEQDAKSHPDTNLEHPAPGPGSSVRADYVKRQIDSGLSAAGTVAKQFNPLAGGQGAKTSYNTRNSY